MSLSILRSALSVFSSNTRKLVAAAILVGVVLIISAFGSGGSSHFAFLDASVGSQMRSSTGATIGIRALNAAGETVAFTGVSVSLPAVQATPGTIAIPVTVSDV